MSKLSFHVSAPVTSRDVTDSGSWINITSNVEDYQFSTGLPGGYLDANLVLTLPGNQAAWWYETMLAAHVLIADAGEPVWEGRVNNIGVVRNKVTLHCRGYWSALTDVINYGFWTDAGSCSANWKEPEADVHVIASNSNYTPQNFRVIKNPTAVIISPINAESEDNFACVIWAFSPDISGANTPKVAPRAAYRIKGHIKIQGGDPSWALISLKYTDDPYTTDLDNWSHGYYWPAVVEQDFDHTFCSYSADPKPFAIMLLAEAHGSLPMTPAQASFTELEVRALRFDDIGGKITAGRILRSLIGGDENLGLGTPEHLVLSIDTFFIEDPDLDIVPFVSEGMTIQEIAGKLASYGDSGATSKEWFPAVWAQKRMHFNAKDTSTIHWIISKAELGESGAEFERTLEGYWPHIYVFHTDSKGRPDWSTLKENKFSQASLPLLRRQQLFADVHQDAVADAIREAQFEFSERPPQQAQIVLTGKIQSAYGTMHPLWKVRAGDTILIKDLAPKTFLDDEDKVGNPLQTFFVRETEYNLANNELTITPGFPTNRADVMIARLTDMTFE